jgi:hypothetical protein
MVCAVLTVCGGVTLLWSQQQIRQLKKELQNEDSDVRVAAITAFRHLGGPRSSTFRRIKRRDQAYGRAPLGLFAVMGRWQFLRSLMRLKTKTKRFGKALCRWPAHLGKVAVSALVELLNDPEARLRRWGANPPVHGARGTGPLLFHAFSRMLRARNSTARGNRELTAALQLAAKDEERNDLLLCRVDSDTRSNVFDIRSA